MYVNTIQVFEALLDFFSKLLNIYLDLLLDAGAQGSIKKGLMLKSRNLKRYIKQVIYVAFSKEHCYMVKPHRLHKMLTV